MLLEVGPEQVRDDPKGDEVQHDRGDDLVDAAGDLQDAGHPGPPGPDGHGDDEDHDDPEGTWQRRDPTHVGSQQRGQLVLALHPDVEQVHLESDGHGQPRDEERDRFVPGVDERIGADPELRHVPERGDRALVDQENGDGGDRQSQQ